MRNRDDGARIVLEETLEPRHRFRVEVVGRFVEQQQIGRQQQQPAQRHAAPLAARQPGDVGIGRRQPERVHREIETRVEVPRVGGVDAILQTRLLLERLVHLLGRQILAELRVDGVVLVEDGLDLGDALFDVAAHILRGIELRLLGQIADADALADEGFADVVGVRRRP